MKTFKNSLDFVEYAYNIYSKQYKSKKRIIDAIMIEQLFHIIDNNIVDEYYIECYIDNLNK